MKIETKKQEPSREELMSKAAEYVGLREQMAPIEARLKELKAELTSMVEALDAERIETGRLAIATRTRRVAHFDKQNLTLEWLASMFDYGYDRYLSIDIDALCGKIDDELYDLLSRVDYFVEDKIYYDFRLMPAAKE